MKSIRLTTEERQFILARREKIAQKLALEKFQEKALDVANRWVKWSKKNGEGLTFSTFVNSFNYQDGDGEQIYAAVQVILGAVYKVGWNP
ncbi:hypothetical protein [Acinetobacter rudis]|uniref:Uncharacterized protein n=1 Tax=Acinetobacter rudis TaxID=632955 RepID=A0AAW8JAC8_9GAMM|nr:hypothetical protein [Acinetobacter rudis]MDQ8937032.1 hypothetical protein [Acinetobacter rudis]MDQ9019237.1 hypothetical protein [Acinetobacter rudis]